MSRPVGNDDGDGDGDGVGDGVGVWLFRRSQALIMLE